MIYSIDRDRTLKISVLYFCFYITVISNLVIFIAQPLQITVLEILASRCYMVTNLVAFLLAINHSLRNYIPYITKQIITIIFIICFSWISYLSSSQGGIYNYIIRLWCFLALPFYFLYINYLKVDRRLLNFIFLINFLSSLVYILLSFSKYSYVGYEQYIGTSNAWLTLGYDNPNQTAMYLVINFIILICAFYYYNKKLIRIILMMDILYILVLLIKTSSRTCILIAGIIIIVILLKRNYRMSKYTIISILLLPAIFIIVYPILYKYNLLYFFSFGGKSDYVSRSDLYQAVLIGVKNQFLFGNFGHFQLQNLHNGILSIYASLGIVGVIFFYIYYIRAYLNLIVNGLKSKTAFIAMIGLLGVFLHSCTEGPFLVGGSMFAGSISILIYLVKLDEKGVE